MLNRSSIFITVLSTCLSSWSFANFIGNDFQLLNPASTSSKYLSVEDSSKRSLGDFNFGLTYDYAVNTYTKQNEDYVGKEPFFREGANDTLGSGNFTGSFTIFDGFDLGVSLPFVLHTDQKKPKDLVLLNSNGITDIRVFLKAQILDLDKLGLAFLFSFHLNKVTLNPYIGTPDEPSYSGILIADFTPTPAFDLAFNVGYRFRPAGIQISPFKVIPIGPQVVYSFAAGTTFENANTRLFLEVLGAQDTDYDNPYINRVENSMEARLGVRYFDRKNFRFTAAIGTELSHGIGTADYRFILGMDFLSEEKNRYGVPDNLNENNENNVVQPTDEAPPLVEQKAVIIAFRSFTAKKLRKGYLKVLKDFIERLEANQNTEPKIELIATYSENSKSIKKAKSIARKRINMIRKFILKNTKNPLRFKIRRRVIPYQGQVIVGKTSEIAIFLKGGISPQKPVIRDNPEQSQDQNGPLFDE